VCKYMLTQNQEQHVFGELLTSKLHTNSLIVFNYKVSDTGAKVDLNTQGYEVLPEGLQDLDQPVCAQMWLAGHQNVLQRASEQR